MRTLVKLSAVLTESDWREDHRTIAALHHEITPGVFIHVGLGPAGLQIFDGRQHVAIPLDDLVTLARAHAPLLGAASPPAGTRSTASVI